MFIFVFQFFEDSAECEQWMSRQADSINIRYSSDESQTVETLQTLLRELQELSDQVSEYERRVSSITHRSREIIPLKQRGQPVFSELRCRCLCIYKQPPVSNQLPINVENKWDQIWLYLGVKNKMVLSNFENKTNKDQLTFGRVIHIEIFLWRNFKLSITGYV